METNYARASPMLTQNLRSTSLVRLKAPLVEMVSAHELADAASQAAFSENASRCRVLRLA